MRVSPQSSTRFLVFNVFFIVTTLFVIVFSVIWYMSPLALGFSQWPIDPVKRRWAESAHHMSYFYGIPMLIIGQVASFVLDIKGFHRLAFLVPTATILFFATTAGTALFLLR